MVQFNAEELHASRILTRVYSRQEGTPGYPQSITFVFVFGSAPKCAGDGENILNQFLIQRGTPKPIIVSKVHVIVPPYNCGRRK